MSEHSGSIYRARAFGPEDLVPCFAPGRNHFKDELAPPLIPPFIGKKRESEGERMHLLTMKYYSTACSVPRSILIDPGFSNTVTVVIEGTYWWE